VSDLTVNVAQAASTLSQSTLGDAVGVAVLKKALQSEQAIAAGLLQALPDSPSLAAEGALGTRVNTFA
jgi:hypothetical protein